MQTYDAIVIGLGGMGSAAASHLAARGRRVLGLERFEPAHDRGSSHGGSRIIRQSYFEDSAYVPLLQRAYHLFEELQRDAGTELMTLCGGLMIGSEDSVTFAGSRRSAEQWGLSHEILNAAETSRRFPTLTPRPDEFALFETKAGFVRPEATVTAHIERARRRGADLHFSEPVRAWEASGAGVRVRTAAREYSAGHLVICPGAWASELLIDLDVPLTVERHVQFWFEPTGGTGPFTVDRHPIYIWEYDAGTQIYGFPADGAATGAKVAFFRRGRECTPDSLDRTVSAVEVQAIADDLTARIPTLPGRFLRALPCMYTVTPDHHFVIAGHPGHAQVTVACGFSGHGFKFVPVIGEILADLAIDGTTRHPIDLFHPGRALPAKPGIGGPGRPREHT
jgi:sarcosine oxidase